MRENEVARSAAMKWFGIRNRAHGHPQTLNGVELSSLIASVIYACNEAREESLPDEAKVDIHVDVNIAEAVDRAVERQFMTDEAIARYQTELAAVRKNLTDAHKELAESKVRYGAVVRQCDTLTVHRDQLMKANTSLHVQLKEMTERADLNFDMVGKLERANSAFLFHVEKALKFLDPVHTVPKGVEGPVERAKAELERAKPVTVGPRASARRSPGVLHAGASRRSRCSGSRAPIAATSSGRPTASSTRSSFTTTCSSRTTHACRRNESRDEG